MNDICKRYQIYDKTNFKINENNSSLTIYSKLEYEENDIIQVFIYRK